MFISQFFLVAADEPIPSGPIKGTTLVIEFDGLDNTKGKILAALYNVPATFPKEGKEFKTLEAKPSATMKGTIRVTGLAPGDYAVAAMYDKNGNAKMDFKILAIPSEKYGFSNNVRPGLLGPPSFSKAKFRIQGSECRIRITLK